MDLNPQNYRLAYKDGSVLKGVKIGHGFSVRQVFLYFSNAICFFSDQHQVTSFLVNRGRGSVVGSGFGVRLAYDLINPGTY